MPWPTPQDYNEAVQSPALCFNLPELKGGRPELTPLGLPRAITGGFASVYRIYHSGRDWAVRCFLRQVADQQQRYEAISDHLTKAGLPYTAGFHYLEQGIKVRGKWYPVLKMDWVQGVPLNIYVEQNLLNPEKLHALADAWLEMLQTLRRQGVAHGDLQHGNVLVHDGRLFLIDYDGMFVPALSSRGSNELGHRNYQHPMRSNRHFGPWLDNFSGWLIYISLLALGHEPALWQVAGDEHLLLRREDLERPGQTDAWQLLYGCRENVPALAAGLQSFLQINPSQVPPPEPAEIERLVRRRHRLRPRTPRTPQTKRQGRSFSAFAGPAWVLDHVTPQQTPKWQGGLLKERLLLGSWLLLNAAVGLYIASGAFTMLTGTSVSLGSSFIALIGLWSRYQAQPVVQQKRSLVQEAYTLKWRIRVGNLRTRRLQQHLMRFKRTEEDDRVVFKQKVDTILEHEHSKLQRLKIELEKRLLGFEDRREQLRLAEARELAQVLADKRMQTLGQLLREHAVVGSVTLPLPATVKEKLDRIGLQNAADLVDVLVDSSGGQRKVSLHLANRGVMPVDFLTREQGVALLNWRRELEQRLLSTIPTPAYGREGEQIRRRYSMYYNSLAQSATHLETSFARQRNAVAKKGRKQTDRALRWLGQRQERLSFPIRKLQSSLSRQSERIAVTEQDLRGCMQQLAGYHAIGFAAYLLRLSGISRNE